MRRDLFGTILPPRTDWRTYDEIQAGAKLVTCASCGVAAYMTHPGLCVACREQK